MSWRGIFESLERECFSFSRAKILIYNVYNFQRDTFTRNTISLISFRRMPAAGAAAMPAVAEGAGQLEDLDEPPEPRARGGGGGRTGLMKPLVVLALPGMYLFYKYSQYRREQRELSRRRVTERELQHLHHKIVSANFSSCVYLLLVCTPACAPSICLSVGQGTCARDGSLSRS